MGTGRKLNFELFNESCNVFVGNDSALIFFNTKDRLIDVNLQIALYLALTSQSPTCLYLLACKMRTLRVEYLTPTLKHLYFTLAA